MKHLIPVVLLTSLALSTGVSCDRRVQSAASQAATPDPTNGKSATSAPTLAPPQNEAASPNSQAIEVFKKVFAQSWSPCGDSWISLVKAGNRSKIIGHGGVTPDYLVEDAFFREIKGVTFVTMPDKLTDADTLNGITWKGLAGVRYTSHRIYPIIASQPDVEWSDTECMALIGALPQAAPNAWSKWVASTKSGTLFDWPLDIECLNGAWRVHISTQTFLPINTEARARYARVNCDPTGVAAFDPNAALDGSGGALTSAVGIRKRWDKRPSADDAKVRLQFVIVSEGYPRSGMLEIFFADGRKDIEVFELRPSGLEIASGSVSSDKKMQEIYVSEISGPISIKMISKSEFQLTHRNPASRLNGRYVLTPLDAP